MQHVNMIMINMIMSILRQFWMILSPNKLRLKIFSLSCTRHCDRGLIVVIAYYFQIWNKKKEHNIIIINRVINSYMGPMYIEIPL